MARFRRLLWLLCVLLAAPAVGQDGPIPARRMVAAPDTDFFGGDIRSIFGTRLEICAAACLSASECRAITFNTSASACFLKSGAGDMVPFAGALSARVVDTPAAIVTRGAARAGDLGFLPAAYGVAARELALEIGFSYPPRGEDSARLGAAAAAAEASGDLGAALADRLAALTVDDSTAGWLAASDLARRLAAADETQRGALSARAVAAAVNGYLRAEEAEEQSGAAFALGVALEATGEGRLSLLALRLAQRLAPSAELVAAIERAEGLFGLRVVDRQVDFEPAAPRACLVFSEALVPAGIDYADYVRVEGGTYPVETEGSQICIEGLTHGSRYAVALRAGLPAASGEVLARPIEQDIYIRDRSPSVRFLGRAYVLPRSPDAAIPVATVNLSEVALRIHRVGARNLASVVQRGDLGGILNGFEEGQLAGQIGALVWEGTGEVASDLNIDVVTSLPIGAAVAELDPGLYAMTARVPGALREDWEGLATQWFVVTDIGVSTLSGADGLHVFLRSLASAKPRGGITVELLARNNEVLGSAQTDAGGYARFDPGLLRGEGGAEAALVTAAAEDGDFAFLSLADAGFDLSDRGVEGHPAPKPVDVFASTERGAYRPGETVHATILARDPRADAVEDLPLTAIVIRPDGIEHARLVLGDDGAGGRAMTLPLDPTAQRGAWRVRIHADPDGEALASLSFLVEDFVPERIDAVLEMPDGPIMPGSAPALDVTVRYLYGAPGAGLAIEGETQVVLGRGLPGFEGYVFGREDEPFQSGYLGLPPDLVTDAEGHARLQLPIPETGPVSRPLSLTATVRVSEGSGRPVERSLTRPIAPEAPMIGLRALFTEAVDEGGTASFEVIAVGPDLARASLGPVTWTLSRIDTTFQWYEIDGNWSFEPISRRERVASGSVTLVPDAPARLDLPVDWGQYELALATADGGLTATSLGFAAGWSSATASSETPDRLDVSLDRAAYRLGDTARLRIDARYPGQALITVVSDRLIAMQPITVAAGTSVVDLDVTEDWGPGAYVTATLYRPMDTAARRNPARALGLSWATVDPGARRLQARLLAPEAAAPRSPLAVALQIDGIAPGETGYATIAAVDVGILNLTGYQAPDPADHYFGQRQLGVEIRDVYGRLIDGMQGTMGRLRSGGDGGMSAFRAPPPTEELVAFFSGPIAADADGRVAAEFDLPDFNGTVRLMAVVWTRSGVGQASQDVLVRDPVVVLASLPRFLAPGDTSRLRLDLTHAFGAAGPIEVRVQAGDPQLLPDGGVTVTAELEAGGRQVFDVPLTAGSPGDQRIEIATTTPDGTVLTKSLVLPVRANDPVLARQDRIPLAAGQTLTLDGAVLDGLLPGTASVTLAAGPLAEFDIPGLLTALDSYPFGCTEQLTSRAMPLLYFDELAAALGQRERATIEQRIAAAIRGVLANQTGAGGFGLWSAEGNDLWLDAYVTDFLSRARGLGHAVPAPAFEAALDNLRNSVNAYGDFEDGGEDLAYALMVLAREGLASIGDLRYYADTRAEAFGSPFAQAQLGLALASYGDQTRADALFRRASDGAALGEPETLFRADFGSALRDAAGVLALSAEARSAAVDIGALTGRVTAPVAERSTQESLWTLLAAHALIEDAQGGMIALNGTPVEGPILRLLGGDLAGSPLAVTNIGPAETLAVVTTFGVPTQPEPAQGNGYRIERAYFTLDGEPASLDPVPLNTRLVAVLTVVPERDLQARLIVNDPLPAGLEIDNPNLLRSGDTGQLAWLQADDVATHSEFRSDRFLAAVDWQGTDAFRLAYIVRAVSPGAFHHPAASVEDMYRPAYRARTAAGDVTVSEVDP